MIQQLFIDTVIGWLGVAGVLVVACVVLSYVFPRLRVAMLGAAAVIGSAAVIYAKGARDRANTDRRKNEEAVQRARKKYEAINDRPDSADSVRKRMSDGSF